MSTIVTLALYYRAKRQIQDKSDLLTDSQRQFKIEYEKSLKLQQQYNHLQIASAKYKDIIDVEGHLQARKQALKQIEEQHQNDIAGQAKELQTIQQQHAEFEEQIKSIKAELAVYERALDTIGYGLYQPLFNFADSDTYKERLIQIRDKQKQLIQNDAACTCSREWIVNGSKAEGKKATKHYAKLMLRAFNGEADSVIADVNWDNIERYKDRLEKSYQAINKLGATHDMQITRQYADLRIEEVSVTFEYEEKRKAEKDEQNRIKQGMKDEEKARREIEKALEDAHTEEVRSQQALDKARAELNHKSGLELEQLNAKIAMLSENLDNALKAKERAKSMAQQTKAGHVYVVSNIGSFGPDVYKIGMTRRVEPQDRIDELSGASVPFDFDVHAIIYTDDAPALETFLHRSLVHKQKNKVNARKEFFDVTLSEISNIVQKCKADIEFVTVPEARQYRESLGITLEPQEVSAIPTLFSSVKSAAEIVLTSSSEQLNSQLNVVNVTSLLKGNRLKLK